MSHRRCLAFALGLLPLLAGLAPAQSPYKSWKNGPSTAADFFPIGVWLQSPRNAAKYKALGINLYVGQWQGLTAAQLAALKKANMPVIGHQTAGALGSKDKSIVRGWSQQDEPDNAQRQSGGGWGPPVTPAEIVRRYKAIRKSDRTRPVFLNFGQGVANENWKGRGVRAGKLEDYPKYIEGADIVSFDIYPVTHTDPNVRGKLEYVARGVERLVNWSGGKVVWNFIECTHVKSSVMPTPADVRTEVWMSLIHGSRGILYFAHEWKPSFAEAGLLKYPAMVKGVTAINREVQSLARVLNSKTIDDGATVKSSNKAVPVKTMVKRHGGATYVFAVAMRKAKTRAKFRVRGLRTRCVATVLGEDREIDVIGGGFADDFDPYGVRLYRIQPKTLRGKTRRIPVASGGTNALELEAGPELAHRDYWLLGSMSGTLPGVALGAVQLPLNFDAFMGNTLALPGMLIRGGVGRLDGDGRAAAELRVPPLPLNLAGTRLDLAFVSFTGWHVHMASNPVGVSLVR